MSETRTPATPAMERTVGRVLSLSRTRAVPRPATIEVAPLRPEGGEAQARRVTTAELAALWSTTRSQIDRLVAAGMPAIDIGSPGSGRRRKRALRFLPAECAAWLAARR